MPRPLVRALGRLLAGLLITLSAGGAVSPAITAAATTKPQVSVTEMYNDLMCVVCHESLAVAQSPEAYQERQQVRTYVAQGLDAKQIEHAMVGQYGTSVLAKPPAKGFNVLVYVIPPIVVVLGIVVLVLTIPKWRARAAQARQPPTPAAATVSDADNRRIDEEMAERF
jgi:cytochrome c-type biogenesis protein CcmH